MNGGGSCPSYPLLAASHRASLRTYGSIQRFIVLLSPDAVIVTADIIAPTSAFSAPTPALWIKTDDGREDLLFHVVPGEASYEAADFVGLTVRAAYALRLRKDVAYLQTPDDGVVVGVRLPHSGMRLGDSLNEDRPIEGLERLAVRCPRQSHTLTRIAYILRSYSDDVRVDTSEQGIRITMPIAAASIVIRARLGVYLGGRTRRPPTP